MPHVLFRGQKCQEAWTFLDDFLRPCVNIKGTCFVRWGIFWGDWVDNWTVVIFDGRAQWNEGCYYGRGTKEKDGILVDLYAFQQGRNGSGKRDSSPSTSDVLSDVFWRGSLSQAVVATEIESWCQSHPRYPICVHYSKYCDPFRSAAAHFYLWKPILFLDHKNECTLASFGNALHLIDGPCAARAYWHKNRVLTEKGGLEVGYSRPVNSTRKLGSCVAEFVLGAALMHMMSTDGV